MNIWALSLFVIFNCSSLRSEIIAPRTLKDAEKYTPLQLQSYHQTEYKLIDPAGDYALLVRSQLVPKRIFKSLTGRDNEKEDDLSTSNLEDYENNLTVSKAEVSPKSKSLGPQEKMEDYCHRHPDEASIFKQIDSSFGMETSKNMQKLLTLIQNIERPIQGRDNPLIRDGFSKMFAQVITEERENGIQPSYGTPHEWSQEFLDKYRSTSTMLASSKLLMALAVGDTNRYMQTDKEGDLFTWIIAQAEGSLGIADVFRESYRLNKGDIYKTLMTIENVMAHQWHNPNRENLALTNRLKPITSGHEYAQDKFGTWYHLFGIMLYGYVEGGVKAHVIGRVEALGSKMLSPGVDKTQKAWMNKQGGLIGGDLADMVKNKTYLKYKSDPSNLSETAYLNTAEDFHDRIAVPLDPNLKSSLEKVEDRTYVYIKNTNERELKNCKVEMIPDMGTGFDSRNKDIRQNVTIGSSSSTLTFFTPNVQRIRGFVKCEGQDETLVFESK